MIEAMVRRARTIALRCWLLLRGSVFACLLILTSSRRFFRGLLCYVITVTSRLLDVITYPLPV